MNSNRENMSTDQEILEKDTKALRIAMIGRGWNSYDKLSTMGWGGGFGYSIWFERWDWHGKRGIKIVFHNSTQDMDKTDDIIRKAAKMALDAWEEHKETVPTQTADGTVVVDPFMTQLLQGKWGKDI